MTYEALRPLVFAYLADPAHIYELIEARWDYARVLSAHYHLDEPLDADEIRRALIEWNDNPDKGFDMRLLLEKVGLA